MTEPIEDPPVEDPPEEVVQPVFNAQFEPTAPGGLEALVWCTGIPQTPATEAAWISLMQLTETEDGSTELLNVYKTGPNGSTLLWDNSTP